LGGREGFGGRGKHGKNGEDPWLTGEAADAVQNGFYFGFFFFYFFFFFFFFMTWLIFGLKEIQAFNRLLSSSNELERIRIPRKRGEAPP
jgi:hypothetical protein